jgi:hypothetical protein
MDEKVSRETARRPGGAGFALGRAYSTDVFDSKEAYLERYPGDAYVDVLGFDDYQSVRTPATRAVFARRLRDVVELAEARGKIPALTETGVEAVPDSTWWTGTLLAGIKKRLRRAAHRLGAGVAERHVRAVRGRAARSVRCSAEPLAGAGPPKGSSPHSLRDVLALPPHHSAR